MHSFWVPSVLWCLQVGDLHLSTEMFQAHADIRSLAKEGLDGALHRLEESKLVVNVTSGARFGKCTVLRCLQTSKLYGLPERNL